MQQAKTIITSNSIFSQSAACLNFNDGDKVVVPENWYLDAPYDKKDVKCVNWTKYRIISLQSFSNELQK